MADEQDPAERVRKLVQFAGQVVVDNSIAPKKYFRSGVEMERMVSISLYAHAEGSNKCRNLQQIEIIGIIFDTFGTTNTTFLSYSLTFSVCSSFI